MQGWSLRKLSTENPSSLLWISPIHKWNASSLPLLVSIHARFGQTVAQGVILRLFCHKIFNFERLTAQQETLGVMARLKLSGQNLS